ncbi:transglutaminaseTgpA domain-containing protein [Herbiconiux sp. CPCC 203407]|uniref:TransglutaminaseTgpA domain-containing protein n=1 Tax=Herbiconiux oxytropis TaxID=2970915 RepID=A0AA42BUP1_9MICO|nr:transglutaminaseTgpA domain-containing protein [Herbiconiux oxytropis]MCS5722590.1 transglutaminaseTgpA domain-containing protein [Herbiconiux oxytropis]MCS5726396.1 transglutaminaseTgpA domain-containing protein [Herbiconiux oxytropis]
MSRAHDPASGAQRIGRTLLAAALVEVLVLVAAATWWPVYESAAFAILAAVTVTVGTLIGVAGAALRWPGPAVLGATVLAWLVLGVPLAVPAKALWGVLPTPAGLADLVVTTGTGWRQLLTISLPVGDYQALLVPVFALLLAASVAGVSVALRTRLPVLALLPALAVLVAGIAFGGQEALAPVVVGCLFAVLAMLWVGFTRAVPPAPGTPPSRSGRRRAPRLVGAVGVVAAGLAGALVVGVLVPGSATAWAPGSPVDRATLRETVEQPFDPSEQPSPLSAYRSFVAAPADSTIMLTVEGARAGERIVLARMDDYDGVVYDVGPAGGASGDAGALFSRVPERLVATGSESHTAGENATAARRTLDVSIGAYSGFWVPTAGEPEAVRFWGADAAALQDSLFYSPDLSTAADLEGLAEGDGYLLEVSGAVLPADPSGVTPGAAVRVQQAGVPDAVATRSAEWAPESRSAGARLAGIVAGLRSGYLSSSREGEVFSRSGHGADRLQELLTASPMVGDAEQYAAAGALLAEAAGFPARVALGFAVPGSETGAAASTGDTAAPAGDAAASVDGPVALRGGDATAWVEVYTAEEGWLALDVTPEPRPVPAAATDDSSTAVRPPDVVPPAPDGVDDSIDQAPLEQDDTDPPPTDTLAPLLLQIALIAGLSLAVLAALLAPFLTVLALKRRRRSRRRSSGAPRARAAGSWAELLDAARDTDLPLPTSATRREAAVALAHTDGEPGTTSGDRRAVTPGAVALAQRVDEALYGPVEPAEAQLAALWSASDTERRRLLDRGGRLARLRARLSTRSLRPYHGKHDDRQDKQ